MQIVLDETGIAVLVGLVGLCTYLGASVLTHLKTSQLRKREETAESESPTSTARARRLSLGKKGFRRTESLKSEHVVFADEISADDEKYSPQLTNAPDVEGILHNKSEVPVVAPDEAVNEAVVNAFEQIQPLDDLSLRRKSLQLTPSGSQSNSNRGSRTDLDKVGISSQNEGGEEPFQPKERALKFADHIKGDKEEEEEPFSDVRKVSKHLRRMELTQDEINSLIDLLLKKEEQSLWVNKFHKPSTVAALRKDAEEREAKVREQEDLVNSLQAKLKLLRSEAADDKVALIKEVRELKEANAALSRQNEESIRRRNQDSAALEELRSRAADLEGCVDGTNMVKDLREKLEEERKENERLSQAITEQQGVIKTALKRIFPSLNVEYCQEHQEYFDRFLAKMREEGTEVERQRGGGIGDDNEKEQY